MTTANTRSVPGRTRRKKPAIPDSLSDPRYRGFSCPHAPLDWDREEERDQIHAPPDGVTRFFDAWLVVGPDPELGRRFDLDILRVEAPRFATQSFPDSFWPHRYFPGRVTLEGRLPEATAEALRARGHEVERWSDWEWRAGGVCVAEIEGTGIRRGAADPRRDSYAVAW